MTHKAFRKTVYDYYKRHGRKLPWRLKSATPYHILVSEIMLQQTQVDRVVDKYKVFIKKFPTSRALANAPVRDIYTHWKGLGYNRRALALKKAAEIITNEYKGKLPRTINELVRLPGVGPYTAAAVRAFAFDLPGVVIETNIRTVYLFHFFKNKEYVTDKQLIPIIEATLDHPHPGRWYSALMDYGAMLKKEHGNISRRSAHHTVQPPFKGSKRELRGDILKALDEKTQLTKTMLAKQLDKTVQEIGPLLTGLEKEGFITRQKTYYRLR